MTLAGINQQQQAMLNEINLKLQQVNTVIRALVAQDAEVHKSWWSVTNAMTISAAVLLFALLVLYLASHVIKSGRNPEAVLRVFGTILIVLIAAFLVVAGYSDTQIAPVMGLLGTIAGYLLGKEPKETNP